ncbi:uncharacterized protein LOC126455941 [Schistocerca serialis cubense]|uniref:uncharacterized protein LOC126455941 n=1 Tax=Schistocerca serialis cubense TaxID=2023355 RepID=UPI00214EB7CE|nr:uncharacterized protein LOC126455941 [Schistocerca serialis cubense]
MSSLQRKRHPWKNVFSTAGFWFVLFSVVLILKLFIYPRSFPHNSTFGFLAHALAFTTIRIKIVFTLAKRTLFEREFSTLFFLALKKFDVILQRKPVENVGIARIIIAVITVFVLATGLLVSHIRFQNESVYNYIFGFSTYFYILFMDFMITMKYIICVLQLKARLKKLNEVLFEVAMPANHLAAIMGYGHQPHPYTRRNIHRMQKAHLFLHEAAELLDKEFGLIIFFDIALSISGTIYVSAGIFTLIICDSGEEHFLFTWPMCVSLFWLLYHTGKLIVLVLSCSVTSHEAEVPCVILIRAAALRGWQSALLETFLEQVAFTPSLQFTAGGFLTVDRQLLVSALTATATYLVILTQFNISA